MKKLILKGLNIFKTPLTKFSAAWIKHVQKEPFAEKIFMNKGIYPIKDHFYQPLINPKKHLKKSLREDRHLPGIDFNTKEQLELLNKFCYNNELLEFPVKKTDNLEYYYDNPSYKSGDGEYLYNIIRHFKPGKIIEIGSGNSTLMAINAINKNIQEDPLYQCDHICVEPYRMDWLEKTTVNVIRKKVEELDIDFFSQLTTNDILFIDSSHIIRPQGDVLFEYLEVLPTLKSGVIIHVHDIFTPKDYLDSWIFDKHLLWNEQYLLEAFLSNNSDFKIIGALNYLSHNFNDEFSKVNPIFAMEKNREPGGFWMVKK